MGADVVQCQCRASWFTVARGGRAGLKYLCVRATFLREDIDWHRLHGLWVQQKMKQMG
ncbi:hypothetical protein BDA96_01G046900 [Sorghum bicolor]|uniref:Uncharacterized protein n=1 Tax=Sorghum bicolor TaxID=4558 RepID=A0A921UZ22_SORBI|nr:hypothetical protein BDA96_01G046900 [Sorghum bicolor]